MPDPLAEESNIPPDDVRPGTPASTVSVVLAGLAAALGVTAFALLLRVLVLDQRQFSESHLFGEYGGVLSVAGSATVVEAGMFVLVLIVRRTGRETLRFATIAVSLVGLILLVWASVAVLVSFSGMGDGVPASLGAIIVAYVLAEITHLIAIGLMTE
jgi:hypothetical protein